MILQILSEGISAGMSGIDVSLVKYIIGGLGAIITALTTALGIMYRGWSKALNDNVEHRQKMAEQMMTVVTHNTAAYEKLVAAVDRNQKTMDTVQQLIIDRIK